MLAVTAIDSRDDNRRSITDLNVLAPTSITTPLQRRLNLVDRDLLRRLCQALRTAPTRPAARLDRNVMGPSLASTVMAGRAAGSPASRRSSGVGGGCSRSGTAGSRAMQSRIALAAARPAAIRSSPGTRRGRGVCSCCARCRRPAASRSVSRRCARARQAHRPIDEAHLAGGSRDDCVVVTARVGVARVGHAERPGGRIHPGPVSHGPPAELRAAATPLRRGEAGKSLRGRPLALAERDCRTTARMASGTLHESVQRALAGATTPLCSRTSASPLSRVARSPGRS